MVAVDHPSAAQQRVVITPKMDLTQHTSSTTTHAYTATVVGVVWEIQGLPTAFDYSKQGPKACIVPVQNQYSCGKFVTFVAIFI
jgi:hypothetical protein